MIESLNTVFNRINDIKRRFGINNNYNLQNESNNDKTNFDEVLNKQIAKSENQKTIANISESTIKDTAKEYAIKNGLPPSLVEAVIKVESGFDPYAVSNKGAKGLMQLMPNVLKDSGISNPFNVEDNIRSGVGILKNLIEKYEWDLKKALAAYNAGENAVDKNNGIPPYQETREFVQKVIDAYIQNLE